MRSRGRSAFKAQRGVDGDRLILPAIERGADGGDLPLETVDEPGAVASADEQARSPEPGAVDLDLAHPVFRVDDPPSARCDRDVVDVTATAGHTAVVQGDDAVGVGALGERAGHRSLSGRALGKDRFVPGRTAQGEERNADAGVGRMGALLAVLLSPLVFAEETRSRLAELQRRCHRRR